MIIYNEHKEESNYDEETMSSLTKELKGFIEDTSEKNAKILSFFTFNQQLESHQYRPQDQDFNKKYDFVFSGCSQTHGDHITKPLVKDGDHQDIWGFKISNHYNVEALNLGMGGWGAESILKGLMHHFQKNGNPKVLLVLYPDLGRIEGVDSNKMQMKTPLNRVELIQHWFLHPQHDLNINKISTKPHDPSDVIPFTHAVYKNLQSILILNEYCKQNNIYFKYSSWDFLSNTLLKALSEILPEYSNYILPETMEFKNSKFKTLTCHKDIKATKQKKIWDCGIDNYHMGIHQHIHVYEQFKNRIDNDNPWN